MQHYFRITKRTARKLYNEGKPVWFCPCKLRPGPPWGPDVMIQNLPDEPRSFDWRVDNFNWYNANHEAGYYPAYYIVR